MAGVPHPLLIGRDLEALDAWRRRLAQAGVPVAGVISPAQAPLRLRSIRPSLLVLVLPQEGDEARATIERCRSAAECAVPAVLILWPSSPWLYAPLPADLEPAVALDATKATAVDLVRVSRVLAGEDEEAARLESAGLILDVIERRLRGPAGVTFLTPSECTLLATLMPRPHDVVRVEEVARALWGTPFSDTHTRAAVRTHLYTLRRKLASVGAPDAVRSVTGVGYRFRDVAAGPAERAG